MIHRRSYRSATCPAASMKNSPGRNSASPVYPSSSAECVICIHLPRHRDRLRLGPQDHHQPRRLVQPKVPRKKRNARRQPAPRSHPLPYLLMVAYFACRKGTQQRQTSRHFSRNGCDTRAQPSVVGTSRGYHEIGCICALCWSFLHLILHDITIRFIATRKALDTSRDQSNFTREKCTACNRSS